MLFLFLLLKHIIRGPSHQPQIRTGIYYTLKHINRSAPPKNIWDPKWIAADLRVRIGITILGVGGLIDICVRKVN